MNEKVCEYSSIDRCQESSGLLCIKTFLSLKTVIPWMAADCATEAHLGDLKMERLNRSSTLLQLTGW